MSLQRKHRTAPDRLAILLDWLNGDVLENTQAIRPVLLRFVRSFDGSAEAACIETAENFREDPTPEPQYAKPVTIDDLVRLQALVVESLRAGFPLEDRWARGAPGTTVWGGPALWPMGSLRIGVRRERDDRKLRGMRRSDRRAYEAPGAYVLRVDGALADLVPYLVMALLTTKGMVTVARCPAPAPDDWRERCGRFFVSVRGRGRRRQFCSDACRVRQHASKYPKED